MSAPDRRAGGRPSDPAAAASPRAGGWRGTRVATRLAWESAGPLVLVAVVATAASSGLPILGSLWGKLLVDQVARPGGSLTRAIWLAVGIAAAGGGSVIVGYLSGYASMSLQRRISLHVESTLYRTVNGFVGLRHLEDPAFQNRLRLADQAAQTAPTGPVTFAVAAGRGVFTVAGYAGVLLVVWPPTAALILLLAPLSFATQFVLARQQARATETTVGLQRRRMFYRSLLTDLRAAKEIRLFGLGSLFRERMVRALDESSKAELRAGRRVALVQSGLAVLNAALAAIAAAVVVRQAVAGRVSPGDVVLFIAAVAGVQSAFTGVANQLGEFRRALRLFGHYVDLVDTPSDLASGAVAPRPLRRGIEFRDVWFRYRPDGPWVLRGVNLFLPAGQAVGLVGVNGAGKSTLVKLLCRFYDPDRGEIRWDGTDLRDLDVTELRRRIGVTFQDYVAYDLTASENIGVGDLDHAGPDDIRHAARLAGVHDVLAALPDGYDTMLSRLFYDDGGQSRSGVLLSGGQWQRVALARSIVRTGADLLILDEPSAGLDAMAEQEVSRTLRAHRRGRTSLLISHRLSTLRDADAILVLADGAVVERGTHDELMAAAGRYRELFSTQAAGYRDDDRPGGQPHAVPGAIRVPIGSSGPPPMFRVDRPAGAAPGAAPAELPLPRW